MHAWHSRFARHQVWPWCPHLSCVPQDGIGKISFFMLKSFVDKYGGATLSDEDMKTIFEDFRPDGLNMMITLDEFMTFFAKVSKSINNAAFEKLVQELMA